MYFGHGYGTLSIWAISSIHGTSGPQYACDVFIALSLFDGFNVSIYEEASFLSCGQ